MIAAVAASGAAAAAAFTAAVAAAEWDEFVFVFAFDPDEIAPLLFRVNVSDPGVEPVNRGEVGGEIITDEG